MTGIKRAAILATANGLMTLPIMVSSASAATSCPSTPGAQSVTFSFTGAEQTCMIPTAVSSVSVTAVGAPGRRGNQR
ncbi:MAG: hypothetical protein M3071_15345 [Actinomycetota bacterium]|nr:hypothetical protein [Actinomycetota bacterium]